MMGYIIIRGRECRDLHFSSKLEINFEYCLLLETETIQSLYRIFRNVILVPGKAFHTIVSTLQRKIKFAYIIAENHYNHEYIFK